MDLLVQYGSVEASQFGKSKLRFVVQFEPETFKFDLGKIEYEFSVITDNIRNFFVNAYNNIRNLIK